jgi:hypothetical protein
MERHAISLPSPLGFLLEQPLTLCAVEGVITLLQGDMAREVVLPDWSEPFIHKDSPSTRHEKVDICLRQVVSTPGFYSRGIGFESRPVLRLSSMKFLVFVSSSKHSTFFLFASTCRPALWNTQCPANMVQGTSFSGVKRPELDADHSLTSSTRVKNAKLLLPPLSPDLKSPKSSRSGLTYRDNFVLWFNNFWKNYNFEISTTKSKNMVFEGKHSVRSMIVLQGVYKYSYPYRTVEYK